MFSLHIAEYGTLIKSSENVRNGLANTRTSLSVVQWRHTPLPHVAQKYRGNNFAIVTTVVAFDFASCREFLFNTQYIGFEILASYGTVTAQNINYFILFLLPLVVIVLYLRSPTVTTAWRAAENSGTREGRRSHQNARKIWRNFGTHIFRIFGGWR
jgi:hypothetical protein